MYKKPQNRTPKAKSLRLKHVIQTCLLIIFSGWVLYELKLLLIKVNSRKTNLISSNVSQIMPRHIVSEQVNLTSKSLIRVETEVVSSRSDARNEDDKKGEGGEGESVDKMMDLSKDHIIAQIQTADNTKKILESSLKSGTEQYESFDYPESTSEHESNEDSFDVEISEETIRTREVIQEDAYT